MQRQDLLAKIKSPLSKISRKGWIIGGSVFGLFAIVLIYSVIFFIPKSIEFSYAGQTCVRQLTIAPDLQKGESKEFSLQFKDPVKIGTTTVATTKVCVEPNLVLEKGEYAASTAPFGGFIARKQFTVKVPSTPVAQVSDLVGKSISTAEPVKISLSSADAINLYQLKIVDKKTSCVQAEAELSCEVASLDLEHGAAYTASLYKSYRNVNKMVFEGEVTTLQPLIVAQSSITAGQTVYDAPTSATFVFDQPIKIAEAALVKVVGETTEKIETKPIVTGNQVTIGFNALEREATYRFDFPRVVADSGSSLAEPLSMTFQTSGGPKPASVSVGSHSVARSATILVTLDQPIDASVDINKFARVEGVTGSVKRKSDTQLAFSIQGGDCTAFNLVIDKGLKSGSNGAESKEAWKFSSRTICGSSWVIGKSIQGRSIVAYSFGTGPKVILFTGGIHGSEPSGTTTMQAWAQHLQAYGDIVPADKRVVIVPNTNPDGIAKGSRNNANNVNLGRNFNTANWSASIETTSGTLPQGGGTSPGSEPEAAALIALTQQLRPRLEISYHARGSLVGANKFADSVSIGDIYAKTVGYRTMFYNAEAVMGYAMTGEYEDWMGEKMNIPAILIELPRASGNYLNAHLPALKKMLAL